jgi:CBS domain-containing protein
MGIRQAEARRIMEISRRRDNTPVRVTTSMHELVERASSQNFIPVVDDSGAFIGIVTRRAIIKYCTEKIFPQD